jgi:hypothetical protein
MDKIRCTVCRGAKQMLKLGGMLGDCNLCKGKGEINECYRPKAPQVVLAPLPSADIIKQVSAVAPARAEEKSDLVAIPMDVDVKADPKKTLYKRKTIAK